MTYIKDCLQKGDNLLMALCFPARLEIRTSVELYRSDDLFQRQKNIASDLSRESYTYDDYRDEADNETDDVISEDRFLKILNVSVASCDRKEQCHNKTDDRDRAQECEPEILGC